MSFSDEHLSQWFSPASLPEPSGQHRARLCAVSQAIGDNLAGERVNTHSEIATAKSAALRAVQRCLDLTSLQATDTLASAQALTRQALTHDPAPAAVCVHSDLAEAAVAAASGSDLAVAAVAGAFPHARAPLAVRALEVATVVEAEVDEVDVVLDQGAVLAHDWERCYRSIATYAQVCRETRPNSAAKLKVILETGTYEPDTLLLRQAAQISLAAGADFLKTSTGMSASGASLIAAHELAWVAQHWQQQHDTAVGVKISGGVRTTAAALAYAFLVLSVREPEITAELVAQAAQEVAAAPHAPVLSADVLTQAGTLIGEFVSPHSFRIGASGLLSDLAVQQQHLSDTVLFTTPAGTNTTLPN